MTNWPKFLSFMRFFWVWGYSELRNNILDRIIVGHGKFRKICEATSAPLLFLYKKCFLVLRKIPFDLEIHLEKTAFFFRKVVFTFYNLNKKIPLQIWNDPMSFEMTPWAKWPHETSQFEMTPWAKNPNEPMAHGGDDTVVNHSLNLISVKVTFDEI